MTFIQISRLATRISGGWWTALAAGLSSAVFGLLAWIYLGSIFTPSPGFLTHHKPVPFTKTNAQARGKKMNGNSLVYPFSVVSGGVRSGAELRQAILQDPVVAAHYADFDVEHVRVERVSKPTPVFVSYRVNDRISWTRKQVQLKEGETILTDGVHRARTRCGNRIADLPQTGGAGDTEPAEETLDLPVAEGIVALPLPDLPIGASEAALDSPASAAVDIVGSTGSFIPNSPEAISAPTFPVGLLALLGVIPPFLPWSGSGVAVIPDQPSQPLLPQQPIIPTEPTPPAAPGKPVTPIQPSLPVSPVTPVSPGAPKSPAFPKRPGTPLLPTTPWAIAQPIPGTPSAPLSGSGGPPVSILIWPPSFGPVPGGNASNIPPVSTTLENLPLTPPPSTADVLTPEPAFYAALGIGLAALLMGAWRRKDRNLSLR